MEFQIRRLLTDSAVLCIPMVLSPLLFWITSDLFFSHLVVQSSKRSNLMGSTSNPLSFLEQNTGQYYLIGCCLCYGLANLGSVAHLVSSPGRMAQKAQGHSYAMWLPETTSQQDSFPQKFCGCDCIFYLEEEKEYRRERNRISCKGITNASELRKLNYLIHIHHQTS